MNIRMHLIHPPKLMPIEWGHHVIVCIWKNGHCFCRRVYILRITGCITLTVKIHEMVDVGRTKVKPGNSPHLYKYCLLEAKNQVSLQFNKYCSQICDGTSNAKMRHLESHLSAISFQCPNSYPVTSCKFCMMSVSNYWTHPHIPP